MNGFERRREKKKKDILVTAMKLFSTSGFKDASIAEIAKEAKVSQVSIYNFFESKENLAKQAYFHFMEAAMTAFEELIESDLPFREKFEKMVFFSEESANQFSEAFFQSDFLKDPTVLKFLEEYAQNKSIPLMKKLIDQGKQEGCIDPELSTEAILLFIDSFKSVLLSTKNIGKKVRADLGRLFFYGLSGEKR